MRKKGKEQESNYIYQPPCFMMSTSTIYVYIYIYNQEKKFLDENQSCRTIAKCMHVN